MIPLEVKDIFDALRQEPNLIVGTCSSEGRPGTQVGYSCTKYCEPIEGQRGVTLLPFESSYLTDLHDDLQFVGDVEVVARGDACPHFQDDRCSLYRDKPITCKMFPLAFHRAGQRQIEVLINQACKIVIDPTNSQKIQVHNDRWVAYFIAMWSYLPESWWKRYEASWDKRFYQGLGIAQFELPGDIITTENIDLATAQSIAQVNCPFCKGTGYIEINDHHHICSCVGS
jgi:Fe-S-cluster containining protein